MARIITYEWHKSKGASFENYFGSEIPSDYGNPEEEYWALRKSAGLRDVSYFGKIAISGKDAKNFLHRMLTNDINSLSAGQGRLALFLNIKGHIQADLKIYDFGDSLLLVLQHYVRDKIVTGLDRYIISEKIEMKDVTEEFGMFQVIGPDARPLLQSKGVKDLPDENLHFVSSEISRKSCHVIRLPIGYTVLCSAADAVPILDSLGIKPVGMKAFEMFRIESGMAVMNRDVGEANFPQETRMDAALDFQKGCYLGQETIARIDAQGHVNKFLMGVASESPVQEGDPVFHDQKEIGKVTSSSRSPLLNSNLSLAYIRREFAKDGEKVEIGEKRTVGIVRKLPLEVP